MTEPEKPSVPDRWAGWMSAEEKEAAMRAQLYAVQKARGSLGTYYQIYPDERPAPPPRSDDRDEGHER